MVRIREPWSPVLRVVGFTLWADALLAFMLEAAGASGFGSGSRESIGVPIACLLLFGAGLFLTGKRDVWRCATCGRARRVARRRSAWFPSAMSPTG